MNRIRKTLTLLVVMSFTSQAVIPERAYASATPPVVDTTDDLEDTEEEDEDGQEQSSFTYSSPAFIVPVVLAVIIVASTIWKLRRNDQGFVPLAGAGAGLALQPGKEVSERRPPTPFSNVGAHEERGSNAVNTGSSLTAGLIRTPGQTPMRRRGTPDQEEVVALPPVVSMKKVAFTAEVDAPGEHTPVLRSAANDRVDTPAPPRQVQPAARSPFVAVLNFVGSPFRTQAAPTRQTEDVANVPATAVVQHAVAPVVNEFDEDEEEDVARARKGKKKGAATAVKRGRRKTDEETVAAAAPLTANLGGKRLRRTKVNYNEGNE